MSAREWILELDPEDRQEIGKDIQKAEFGWPIGMPSGWRDDPAQRLHEENPENGATGN